MRTLPTLLVLLVAVPGRADSPEDHWAWKAPTRPAVPAGAANPIDAFIRARLKAAGLEPAPPATREQLIRRVTFDLHGLPPTPEEIDAFVKDTSPDAWEKVIDRLLASPRYGERWARHWLDLARYADTNGYEFDEPRPDAWRYRDYVIRSLNIDKPFDRFIIEQLAGDELWKDEGGRIKDEANPSGFGGFFSSFILHPSSFSADALIATGFNLLGPDMTDSADQAQRRLNTLNDMTDTAGLAFLGLTITCARCHDHKFEPIPQKDYFRLQAFFIPAAFRKDLPISTPAEEQAREARQQKYLALTRELREEIAAIEEPHRKRLYEAKLAKLTPAAQAAHRTPPEKRNGGQQELVSETEKKVAVTDAEVAKALTAEERAKVEDARKRLKEFNAQRPPLPPVAMGLTDQPGPPPKTFLLERGQLANKGAEVNPGFPTVLSPNQQPTDAAIAALPASTGRRLALAKWIASKDNPLTARVIVNRLWQHHFGRGIVPTASDFGTRGEDPTHPELLDWLASELVKPSLAATRSGARPWSLKRIHKLMLLSETYRQSTHATPAAATQDPDNLLFSRMNRLRLEGEAVRDAMLAVSGQLNPKMFGPGVVLPEASRAAGGSRPVPVTADAKEYTRRTIYLFSRRNLRYPFLEVFDLPDSNLSCPKRERSTTAPQALALLNSPEALAAAKALAERLTAETKSESARIERAYRLTLGRSPSPKELDRATAFLKDSPLSELCRALFNLNEFVYLD
jgi:hypothetical protein